MWFKPLRDKYNNLTPEDAENKIMYLFSLHFIIVSPNFAYIKDKI